MTVPARSWLMLVTGDRRVRGGEYDDSPDAYYSWDSTVPRSQDPQPGDGVVLWDGESLLGVSVISAVERGATAKNVHRCPQCGAGRIKLRKRATPRYRCDTCGALFDEAATVKTPVTTFRAHYAAGWVDLAGRVNGDDLRAMTDNPRSQHAIRPIAMLKVRRAAGGFRDTTFEAAVTQHIPGGHKIRLTRARLGQGAFREALLKQFDNVCAFTGPGPREALQAAHLYSYAASGKHDRYGGWLMRSDLHTLFDLGHVAVCPDDLIIDLTPEVRAYASYAGLHGQPVAIKDQVEDRHRAWLELHWSLNRSNG